MKKNRKLLLSSVGILVFGTATLVLVLAYSNCGTPSGSGNGSSLTTAAGTTIATSQYYSCPVVASQDCEDTWACQSTCVGQLSGNPTCTYYAQGGIPGGAAVEVGCTALASVFTTAYSCPVTDSTNCSSASSCESTCQGQLQTTASCTAYAQNAVGTSVACTPETSGTLYLCPVELSNSCNDMSLCQSSCMGQYTTQSTCTYYNQGGIPGDAGVIVPCTSVGTF